MRSTSTPPCVRHPVDVPGSLFAAAVERKTSVMSIGMTEDGHRRRGRAPRSTNPKIVYAALWEARQAPWEERSVLGPGSGLYKSIDGAPLEAPHPGGGIDTRALGGWDRILRDPRACSANVGSDNGGRSFNRSETPGDLDAHDATTPGVVERADDSPR